MDFHHADRIDLFHRNSGRYKKAGRKKPKSRELCDHREPVVFIYEALYNCLEESILFLSERAA